MRAGHLPAKLVGQLLLLQLLAVSAWAVDHVHIAGFFPMSDVEGRRDQLGWGVMPSVKLALRHVNQDPHILPNTVLHVTWNDTQCNAAVAIKAFYDLIHNSPSKLVLFGAACTHVTDPVAKASRYWNLAQVTYADTHPKYTARDFPNFFRVVPNARDLDIARIAFITKQGWKRVGTLCQDNPRYTLAHNDMVGLLHEEDVSVVAMQTFADKLTDQLEKLMGKDVRVVLGSFDERWARRIFCRAHRLGMYGRKYQWLLVGMYSENWWRNTDDMQEGQDEQPCTVSELEQSVQGVMLFDILHLSNNQRKTVAGLTALQYKKLYDAAREGSYSRFHGYAYDGIWAIAYALHHVDWLVRRNRSPLPGRSKLTNFRYQDRRWESLILSALKDTSFEGVTGPVKFRNNDRRGFVVINQIKDNLTSCVGVYDLIRLRWLTNTEDDRITSVWWPSGHAPVDQTITYIQKARVNLQIYVILVVLASLGIVMAVVFLFVNVRYRNQRYIKMSSPYLNNLIIVGCMLTYTSVILLGLDTSLTSETSFPIVCAAKSWVLMAGFTLAFGSMFSKTWRVHSIFTDIKLNKKVIKDYQLYIVVGILLSIDIAIMTTWQIFDPFYRDTKLLKGYPHPTNDDAIIVPEIEYCKSDRMTIFVGCIYAYKGLLMIFGCFLAWETRHVNIAALNDSKYIGMSVYNVVIMCVIGVAISFVLADHQDAAFLIISVFILFCTTGTLCLVFVPKLIELRKSSDSQHQQKLRATLKPPSKKGFQYSSDSAIIGVRENTRRSEDLQARLRLRLNSLMHEYEELKTQVGDDAETFVHEKMPSASQLIVPRLSCMENTEITSVYSYPEGLTTLEMAQNRKRSSVQPHPLPAISASVSSLRESSSGADGGPPVGSVPAGGVYAGREVTLALTATDSAHPHGVVVLENSAENQCGVNGGISMMFSQYKQWNDGTLQMFRPVSASSGERRSLECAPSCRHLAVPSSTQPRRCSDPGFTKFSLANAIHEVNLSLSNIIKAASLSTASFTTEISCSAEFAPFQILDSSGSINNGDILHPDVSVVNCSTKCPKNIPNDMSNHTARTQSSPTKIPPPVVLSESVILQHFNDRTDPCTVPDHNTARQPLSCSLSSSCSTISRCSGTQPPSSSLRSASPASAQPGSATTCSWPQSVYSCHSSTDSLDSLSAEYGDSAGQQVSDSVLSAPDSEAERTGSGPGPEHGVLAEGRPRRRARGVQTLVSGTTLQKLELLRDSKLKVVNIDPSELIPITTAEQQKTEPITRVSPGTTLQSGSRHSNSCPRLLGGTLTPFFQSDLTGNDSASDLDPEQRQIVPIFHRLAYFRQMQTNGQGWGGGKYLTTSSCPNISIRCDIVEHL